MARDKEAQPHAKKKRAFQVGPKLAKGAYTGHAQRIKKTLIHKAKVKKEYAKALKEAGYSEPSRGKGRGDESEEEEMDTGPIIDTKKEEEEKERLRRRLYGDDLVDEENEMSEDEFERDRKGGRSARFTRKTAEEEEEESEDSPTPSPEPEEKKEVEVKVQGKSREPLPSQANAAKDGRPKSRGGKGRGKKPTTAPPPPVPEVKKTGQQQQQQPKRPKLTEAEIEKIREKKRAEKRDAGRKTQRGQAKLGAKMEGLLGKIQRSLAK